MKDALLLAAACGALFFTGLGRTPFYTRGEPREALVVREITRTGEWLVPSRPEGELTRKPPAFYWAAASATSLLPDHPELAARLPSAVAGTAGVLLTWAAVHATAPAAALAAGLVLATTLEWLRAATTARVDMILVAGLTLLFAVWWRALARDAPRPDARSVLLAALGAAVATLAKGPVALVLPALAAAALAAVRRDPGLLRRLGVVPALALAAAIAGLWYGAAFQRHGWAFFDVVAKENWLRFVDSEDAGTGHAHGMAYLPVLALAGLMPWTPLLPLAGAPLADRRRRTPAVTFAGVWTAVILIFFSLASAKRSVYLLPLFPALAALLALGIDRPPAGRLGQALRLASALYVPAFAVLGLAAAALGLGADVTAPVRPWLTPRDAQASLALVAATRAAAPALLALAGVSLAAAVLVARARRGADWRALVRVVVTLMVVWAVAINLSLLPALARAASLAPFMARIDRMLPPDATLYATDNPDPGLRFYAPRRLEEWHVANQGPAFLLLWEDERQRWRDERGGVVEPLAVSEARQSKRGPLTLLLVPPGTSLRPRRPPA